jgi:hypothetical protein
MKLRWGGSAIASLGLSLSFGLGCAPENAQEKEGFTDSQLELDDPPPASIAAGDPVFSHAGPVAGDSCVQIVEPSDPFAGATDYLCSRQDYGLRWSYAGPIEKMICVSFNEAAAPASETWGDNYLCAPRDYGLQFSMAGPIPGKNCIQIDEPAEPPAYAFADNYLCYSGSVGGGIQVTRATYGGNAGVPAGNATENVATACNGRPFCDYLVSVNVLGDPAYGVRKDFGVDYTCSGVPRNAYAGPEANGAHLYLTCDGTSPPAPPPPSFPIHCWRFPVGVKCF